MSTINKTSVLSQFSSALSALNVSTEETERLVMYLKSAINAEVSADSIISELTSRVEGIAGSAELKEIVLLAVATNLATENRVLAVPNLSTLTGMTNAIAGTVFFVESEGLPYIRKSNATWVVIDPSLQDPILENAWAWGQNLQGQLGDDTTVSKSSPVSVVGGFTDWVALHSGSSHSIGLRANGTIWAWGANATGQLGTGNTTSRSSPVSVIGGFADWLQISTSARSNHNVGVRTNGTAWAWGNGGNGRLGDGSYFTSYSPVSVLGSFTDWVQVSAGTSHSAGIRANGTAWSWGYNGLGRLGDGTFTTRTSPVSVVGGFTDWTQISAGHSHTMAIRANGTLWGWGEGSFGKIGNNQANTISSPVSVVGGFTDWIQVSAGNQQSVGIRANGTAWAWGGNVNGQLGDNSATNKSSPVSVVGGFTDWVELSAGGFHSSGIRANGTAWAWGGNAGGGLGDNSTTSRSSPVSVVGGFTDWIKSSAGTNTTLGLRGS